MAPQAKVYQCPECKKNINKANPSVGCGYCDDYYHLPCAEVPDDQYKFLLKHKNCVYKCKKCTSHPAIFDLRNEMRSGFAELVKSIDAKLDEFKEVINEKLRETISSLKVEFKESTNALRNEMSSKIKEVTAEISNCYSIVKHAELDLNNKIKALETTCSIQQRRLNRADIVITGIPKGIKHLRDPVKKIASLCNVELDDRDIQHATYFAQGKSVLVKFNSVYTRDLIMRNYIKSPNICLKDVVGGEANSKIYLNDHNTRASSNLLFVCRKLRKAGKITKYTLINTDIPTVRVTLHNNEVKNVNLQQCSDFPAKFW